MIARTLHRFRSARLPATPHPATWLAFLVPVFAWAQLTYPGYFEFQSGFLPIFNLNDLLHHMGALSWIPVIGQPYDLLRGDGSLPYRMAAAASVLGTPVVGAVKWIFGASMLAGALGMYGWARRRLGPWPALLAGTVYAFWPIGLATVYVRGAFGEAVLLGLMPWVLWSADAAVTPGRRSSGVALALALAAALGTQTGLALWLAGLVLLYVLVQAYAGTSSVPHPAPVTAVLGWAGGILLGALGLLPPLLRYGVGGGAQVAFASHFVYPYQLLLSGWGLGPSVPGPYDTLTFDLGVVAFCLAVFAVLPLADHPADHGSPLHGPVLGSREAIRKTQYFAVAVILLLVFLSSTLGAGLWRLLSGLEATLTYPWQLLLLAGPWLAWLAGSGGRALADRFASDPDAPSDAPRDLRPLPLFAALVTLILIGSYGYLSQPTTAEPAGDFPVAIFGDNEIALLEAHATGVPGPGRRVVVEARWQALRPLDRDYSIFVHAETPDGTRWAQVDTMPQGGKLPTSEWRPGQVISDSYTLTFAPDAPAVQSYRYLLGLYLWQTGERLSTGAGDTVTVGP
jgi:hypothetical protein